MPASERDSRLSSHFARNRSRPEDVGQAQFPGILGRFIVHTMGDSPVSRRKNEPVPGRERLHCALPVFCFANRTMETLIARRVLQSNDESALASSF